MYCNKKGSLNQQVVYCYIEKHSEYGVDYYDMLFITIVEFLS